jgi:hypothetical protein
MATIFRNNRPWIPLYDRVNERVDRADQEPGPALSPADVAEWVPRQVAGEAPQYSPDEVRGIMAGQETVRPRDYDTAVMETVGAGQRVVNPMRQASGGGYAFGSVPAAAPDAAGVRPAQVMVDRDGDGIPDGAEVTRRVTMAGPDGSETVETAKWVKGPAAAGPERVSVDAIMNGGRKPGRGVSGMMEKQEDHAVSVGMDPMNRDTHKRRVAERILGARDVGPRRVFELEQDTRQRYDPAVVMGEAQVGAAAETAKGMIGAAGEQALGAVGAAGAGRQRYTAAGGGAVVDQDTGGVVYPPVGQAGAGLEQGQVTKLGDGRSVYWTGSGFIDAVSGEPVFQKPGSIDPIVWLTMTQEQKDAYAQSLTRGAAGGAGGAPGGNAGAGITPEQAQAELARRRAAAGR